MKLKLSLTMLCIVFASCSTVDPTAGKKFDPQSKNQCLAICQEADLSFQSLVVVAGMAGCVCGNKEFQKNGSTGSVMGGAVAAVIAEEQQQRQQASNASRR